MDINQLKKQRIFFNNRKHQYKKERIFNPPPHTRLELDEILKRVHKKNNSLVADFGAGSGRITIPLLQKGYTVWAIDISEESLKNLQSIVRTLKLSSLFTANTFPSQVQFSSIVGADILHHINLDETLPLIYRSLLPGGNIVFSEPCAFNLAWYIYLPLSSEWSVEKGIVQCRYFNLMKKFKRAGFQTVSIHGFGILPTPLFNWSRYLCFLNNRLGDVPLLKFFAYRFIIEAIK